jgi:hypothetical protein
MILGLAMKRILHEIITCFNTLKLRCFWLRSDAPSLQAFHNNPRVLFQTQRYHPFAPLNTKFSSRIILTLYIYFSVTENPDFAIYLTFQILFYHEDVLTIWMLLGAEVAQSVQRLGYGLDDWGIGTRFLGSTIHFSLFRNVQTGSGAHPASYKMGTGSCFPGSKAAGAWSLPLTPI